MPGDGRRFAARAIALAAVVLFAGATVVGLQRRHPASNAVLLYLTPGPSEDDMVRVYTSVLGTANPRNRGFTLHDGIAGVNLAGDEAQTILIVKFRDGIAGARREQLIAAFRRSSLVSRVEPAAP